MTHEELEGNELLATYMGAKYPLRDELSFPMDKYDVWLPFHGIKHINRLEYHKSMDWLYPVYQKICKYTGSEKFDLHKTDPYGYEELTTQFNICYERIGDGEDISELFKEIVEWIKIYNEKVLEDDKT